MAAFEPTVVWKAQAGPQTALISCPVFEVFYGGARGGGKTEGSIGDWLSHSGTYGEGAIGIFFRRKYVQLAEVIARTKQLFPKLGGKYNEQRREWTMPGGGRLKFAYLENDSDAEEYQGHSYTRVYVEEVTNFPSPAPIDKLRACLRSGAGVPTGMRLTGNPGGAGHNWVKKRYIDPAPQGFKVMKESCEMVIDGRTVTVELDRVFIPSKLKDNHLLLLNDPTYVLRLRQSGSEALVKAWLEGDWNIVDGAFFPEFGEKHILSSEWRARIPPHTLKFRAHDWGSAKPFSTGWYAVSDGTWGLPEGALYRFQEWYGSCGTNKGLRMTADMVAKGTIEREKQHIIRYGIADPAIFIKNGGPSIGETMSLHGCAWKKADNKRIPGWQQVRQRLVGIDGEPMLYLDETCTALIEQLQTIQHDEGDSEDLDTEAEDHALDELRYGCMSRPWVVGAPKSPEKNLHKGRAAPTIAELMARTKSNLKKRVQRL
jgi:hypothetical protein